MSEQSAANTFANVTPAKAVQTWAFRLHPHQPLKASLQAFADAKRVTAGSIVTCVGSLEDVTIRFAAQAEHTRLEGRHEIVSLTGCFSADDGEHIHISVADSCGAVTGGHLIEGHVYTTAELVVAELQGLAFTRQPDATYGYNELCVARQP